MSILLGSLLVTIQPGCFVTCHNPAWLFCDDDTVEGLVRKLASESIEERSQAEAELLKRGQAAMKALDAAHRKATDPAQKAKLRTSLEKILASSALAAEQIKAAKLTFRASSRRLSEVTGEIQRLTRIPVEIDGTPPPDPAMPDLAFQDAPLEGVLDAVTRQVGGFWLLDGNRILVIAPGRVPLRIFDVRDLSYANGDEAPLLLEPRVAAGAVAAVPEPTSTFTGEDLANIIKNTVDKENWAEADGKSIQFMNGLLIVRNEAPTQAAVEKELRALRSKALAHVRLEVEAWACKPGQDFSAKGLEQLRQGAGARSVGSFQRTTFNRRRLACASTARSVFLTGYTADGTPVLEEFHTGAKMNLRASLTEDRQRVRVDLEAGFSKVLSVQKKKTEAGDVQTPEVANHVLRTTQDHPAGRWVLLGRVSDTSLEEGLPDIVVMGRFTPTE